MSVNRFRSLRCMGWHLVPGAVYPGHLVHGSFLYPCTWHLVPDTWCLTPRCLACAWHREPGTRVQGTRYRVPGTRGLRLVVPLGGWCAFSICNWTCRLGYMLHALAEHQAPRDQGRAPGRHGWAASCARALGSDTLDPATKEVQATGPLLPNGPLA